MVTKSEDPETISLLAYVQIIVDLARKHGATGWHFRAQLFAGGPFKWNELNPYSARGRSTILLQMSRSPVDSTTRACALHGCVVTTTIVILFQGAIECQSKDTRARKEARRQ